MLRSINSLTECRVQAVDGEAGQVDQFLIDESEWRVSHLVLAPNGPLSQHRLVVPVERLLRFNSDTRQVLVALTCDEIRDQPGFTDDDLHEADTFAPGSTGGEWTLKRQLLKLMPFPGLQVMERGFGSCPPVRSTRQVAGFHIRCEDRDFAIVKDFVVDDSTWVLRYVVIALKYFWARRAVLIDPKWIKQCDWANRKLLLNMKDIETIENGPGYDMNAPITREYEERVHAYYNRPVYWDRTPSLMLYLRSPILG